VPVQVQFEKTEVGRLPEGSEETGSFLRSLCEQSVESLKRLILEELRRRLPTVEVSEGARKRFPSFRNIQTLLDRYGQCFRIEKTEDGARLVLDRTLLVKQGLPEMLPELLEYGSEIGVSPVAHLRTAWRKFLTETVDEIVRSAV
jgi:hypothetical protein